MAKKIFQGSPTKISEILINRIEARIKRFNPKDPLARLKMVRIAQTITAQAKLNLRSQGLIDTGRLINSIQHKFSEGGRVIKIGSFGLPYAAIHEFGGTVVPVRRKFLTIPQSEEYKNRSALDFPDLFVHKDKDSKKLFLARNVGGNLIYAYSLKKHVEIRARPYLVPAFDKHRNTMRREMRIFIRSVYDSP